MLTTGLLDATTRHAVDRPHAVAVVDDDGETTYGELRALVDDRATLLAAGRVRVLALALDNGADWIAWDLAAARAGIVCVPLPPFFSATQRRHVLAATGADAIVDDHGMRRLEEAAVELPPGTAKITFTSGSTGEPKGVCLPLEGLERVAASVVERLEGVEHERHLAALPMAVLLENVAGVYGALLAGCRIEAPACAHAWTDPRVLHARLSRHGAHTVILVPELLRGLTACIAGGGEPLTSLRFAAVGGALVAPPLLRHARSLGLPAYQGYGLSECGSVVALNTPGEDHDGSVGKVLRHVDLEIVDGEIVVNNPAALGYLGAPPMNRLFTGDLGRIDADGRLTVDGRRKNLIITSYGRNISPEWIESLLLARESIAQAVVCGDDWPRPGALIVAAPGAGRIDLAAGIAAVNRALPGYARIGGWLAVDAFTVENGLATGTGRVRRERIINQYIDQLESIMNSHTFFDRLCAETEKARTALYAVPQIVDGLDGRISRDTYVAYLTQAYHHVRHTVPLLMAMGARLGPERRELLNAVIDYINEEKGHEEWILGDIRNAGADPDEARRSAPHPATEALIAYNYDYIQRRNPIGFLGMVYMLESTSTEIAARGAVAIRQSLDLPNDAVLYLASHGMLDEKHMAFFADLVNRITDPVEQEAIVEVACTTFHLFANVMRAIPHDGKVRDVA